MVDFLQFSLRRLILVFFLSMTTAADLVNAGSAAGSVL